MGSVLLSCFILAALSLPVALWRLDDSHVVVSCLVPFSFLPMAAALIVRRSSAGHDRSALTIGGVTAVLVLVALGSHAIRGGIDANIRVDEGRTLGYSVANGGRSFVIASKAAAGDLQRIVDTTAARAKPGQTLFVGPQDLRRTNFNDVFVYYLLPTTETRIVQHRTRPAGEQAGITTSGRARAGGLPHPHFPVGFLDGAECVEAVRIA